MSSPYISELGQFLREMKQRDPTIETGQKQGRAIWWDKNLDPDMYARFRQSAVAQPAYVYQPKARR
ncbi:MAG TPA: DUF3460 family protein [Burkholderiaceae bacterium]|nr:DUF3460 family protein [Burkholderiaceae bacterium]